MGNPWDVRATEWLGKALPNEVTKLNSYSKYIQYIPYVGQALSVVMKGMSAVDSGATAYADTYKSDANTNDSGASRRIKGAGRAIPAVISGVQGKSQDPGIYGSPGGNINRDWANIAGQIGNYLPGMSKDDSGSYSMDKGSVGLGSIGSAINNPYFSKKSKRKAEEQSLIDLAINNKPVNNLGNSVVSKISGTAGDYMSKMANISTSTSILKDFIDSGKLVEEDEETEKKKDLLSKLMETSLNRFVMKQSALNKLNQQNQVQQGSSLQGSFL